MIKKIWEIILKLPIMLLIIVLTGYISWESLSLINEHHKAEKQKEKIEYEHYGNNEEKYYALNKELLEYLTRVVVKYKEDGMNGIESFYEEISKEHGYRLFDLVIADGNYMYDSSEEKLHVCLDYEANHLLAMGKYKDSPAEVRLLYGDKLYKSGAYGWISMSIYEFVDEGTHEFLMQVEPELTIRISARAIGATYYYKGIDNVVIDEKSQINKELGNYISDAVSRLVASVVFYVILWVIEIIKLKKRVSENENCTGIDKINTEFTMLGIVVFAASTAVGFIMYNVPLQYVEEIQSPIVTLITCVGVSLTAGLMYGFITIMIKKLCRGRFIQDLFITRSIDKVSKVVKETYGIENYGSTKDIHRLYIKKVVMDIFVTLAIAIYMSALLISVDRRGYADFSEVVILIISLIMYVFYIYKSFGEYKYIRVFNKVAMNIDYLYQGMYELVEKNDDSEIMIKLGNLSQGFERSLAKQIEAEKLQVELITNVSHDLKTPLTSIISYVDLLAKEDLPAVAADYVKILEDKSDRLKSIVSDVFDLAKASSGEEIQLESLDGMVLVNQVLSDMDDAIKESGRDIKIKSDLETAPITANGQKLYRVFQNVIGNALKYSMPGTRIYINTFMDGNEFVFNIKNVSEYEIDFTEEEILSRFVRGDKSRHSEGNGLGLSIAKSFTEQCGGRFAVKIDDDMFKVIIRLR